MYSVNVRDHFMIAHSFRGEAFGPAQRLHGATYVVDATFSRRALDADGMVVDIARATEVLRSVLAEFNLRNLDDDTAFQGQNTTTEFMARVVFERIAARAVAGELGPHAGGLESLRVQLHESHVAWAAYEGALAASPAA
jgi:6-pyruvoyltetrahydropterin/6-carboxytetrahydropterin synthase